MPTIFNRDRPKELTLDWPSDYINEVGWCQDEDVVARKVIDNVVVAYTCEGAIDAWGRNGSGRGQYVVPLKQEISRIVGNPVVTFWNSDPKTNESDAIRAMRQAEDRIIGGLDAQ